MGDVEVIVGRGESDVNLVESLYDGLLIDFELLYIYDYGDGYVYDGYLYDGYLYDGYFYYYDLVE